MSLVKRILTIVFPKTQKPPLLGRWNLKHNFNRCEDYIQNYYGDPGYPNTLKQHWIDSNLDKDKKMKP